MTPGELIKAAIESGAKIKAEGGRLFVKPSEVLPTDLRDQIRTRKAEVIAFLENAYFDQAISDEASGLNRQGARMMDVPEDARRKSAGYESEMTAAANRGDREAFDKAISAWRRCFALPSPSEDPQRTITAYSEKLSRRITISWTGDDPREVYVDGLPFNLEEIASMRQANPTGSELAKILMVKEAFSIKPD